MEYIQIIWDFLAAIVFYSRAIFFIFLTITGLFLYDRYQDKVIRLLPRLRPVYANGILICVGLWLIVITWPESEEHRYEMTFGNTPIWSSSLRH